MENRAPEPDKLQNAVSKVEEATATSETLYLHLEKLSDVKDHEYVQVQGNLVRMLKYYAKTVSELVGSSVRALWEIQDDMMQDLEINEYEYCNLKKQFESNSAK